jgi:flagellar export protein FliJ
MAKFRLATLLKIRERERDLAAKAVQEVQLAIDTLHHRQREIDEAQAQTDAFRKQASHGQVNLSQILDAQRYQMILAAQAAQIADHQSKLQQELQRRQFALLQCQQAVKSLEKLREHQANAATTQALAKQQERLDEWSSIQTAMRLQSDSTSMQIQTPQ